MFKLDPENYVVQMVEALLPRFSPKEKGLVVELNLSAFKYFEDGDEFQRGGIVRFLFQRPSNYTKVFYAFPRDNEFDLNKMDWSSSSNHDSCWRGDGVGSPLSKISQIFRDEFRKEHPDCKERLNFNCFTAISLPKFVDLEVEDNCQAVTDKEMPFAKRYQPVNIKNIRDAKVEEKKTGDF